MTDIAPGALVDDRYRVVSRLGAGGMAEVYLAEDLQLGRQVALKLLYPRFAQDAEFVERFRREASSAAGLQHQNVVGVYDRGEWQGVSYIAMEYLEGRTLKQLIQQEAPLEAERAIEIAIQILRATRFAHRRGIVHRDLKPHNVIVGAGDRIKVTDFGIARAGASDMTETGSIMGTAQYLSPEQAQGHAVSGASDLYSIGIVIYEMLTGRVPFEGESAVAIALKQVNEEPPPPRALNPAIPPELEAAVLHALRKDPSARFADADEFIAALERSRLGLIAAPAGQPTAAFAPVPAGVAVGAAEPPTAVPVAAEPPAPLPLEPPALPPRERGRPWWPWALLAILIAGGAGLAFALTRPDRVVVPAVVGKSAEAATTILQNDGFQVARLDQTSDRPRGTVVRQDPQPGGKADKGSTVTLRVSSGPGQALVPDVTKEAAAVATKALRGRGFRPVLRKESSDAVPEGRVTRTVPGAGTSIDKGTTVTVYVSSGREPVVVPGVVGLDRSAAEAKLRDAGLGAAVTEEASEKDSGTVLRQTPGPGAQARKGDDVALVVAKAPDTQAVPDVVGDDQSDAATLLSERGFVVVFRVVDVATADEDGVVASQRPAAGDKAKKGSRVTITVGRFTPPAQPDTTTTTPTP